VPILVSLQGNCYPDHLFRSARRLLHRIALAACDALAAKIKEIADSPAGLEPLRSG
jgi:hypothetical protein